MAKTPSGVLKVVAVDQYGIVVGRSSLVSILDTASRTPANVAKVYLTDEYGNVSTLAIPTPENILLNAQGLKAQSFDRQVAQSYVAATSGVIYLAAIPLRAGDVVTNVLISVGVVGSGVTTSLVGLYDTAGNRLAVSADQGTAWQSTGLKQIAMGTPYTVPTTGVYYGAFIAIASTTQPQMLRGLAQTSIAGIAVSGKAQPFGAVGSQTGLPSSITIGSASAVAFWIGVN